MEMAGLECYPCDEEEAGETPSASPASLSPSTVRAKRDVDGMFKHDIGATWHPCGERESVV